MNDAELLAGHLTLRLGGETAIACERPMVSQAMMRRLTEGRRAALLPDLIGTVFALCAAAQRSTARRAVAAAFGLHDAEAAAADDRLLIALTTAREHLQRFALDLPQRVPVPGTADPGWLRDAPVQGLPMRASAQSSAALRSTASALSGWLERRLLGLPPREWLQRWQAAPEAWLAQWCESNEHPLALWLRGVRAEAERIALPCRPLGLIDDGDGEAGWRTLAATLATEPDFPERPLWQGQPAETGPWTRHGRSVTASTGLSLWRRIGARLADLVHLALGDGLACGACTLGPGEGIAWTEMSRGLLVHWVRLEDGPQAPDTARAAAYRVLAPTEWNFHPDGPFAAALRERHLDAAQATLAAAALDPCIRFDVIGEAAHA